MKTIRKYNVLTKFVITILFLQLNIISFGSGLADSTHIRKGVWGDPPNLYVFRDTDENEGYFVAFPWEEISEKVETEDLIIEYWVYTSIEDAEMAVVERMDMSQLFLGNILDYPLPDGFIGDNCWQSFTYTGSVLFIRNNILVFIMPKDFNHFDAKSIESRVRNIDLIISQQKKVYNQNEIPAPVIESFNITSDLPQNIDDYVDIKIVAKDSGNQKLVYRQYASGFALISETGEIRAYFNKNIDFTGDSTKGSVKIWVWDEDHFVASAEQEIPFLITSSYYYQGWFEEGSLKAKMEINSPNPFKGKTNIGCFIPETVMKAEMLIFNMQGTLIKTYEIPGRNQAEVTISGAEFNPGMYIYSLVLDNIEIDSKRMILKK